MFAFCSLLRLSLAMAAPAVWHHPERLRSLALCSRYANAQQSFVISLVTFDISASWRGLES